LSYVYGEGYWATFGGGGEGQRSVAMDSMETTAANFIK
jgi:hypothetical protein